MVVIAIAYRVILFFKYEKKNYFVLLLLDLQRLTSIEVSASDVKRKVSLMEPLLLYYNFKERLLDSTRTTSLFFFS